MKSLFIFIKKTKIILINFYFIILIKILMKIKFFYYYKEDKILYSFSQYI